MLRRKPKPQPPLLHKRFQAALTYAARLHVAQVRKTTKVPYVSHLLGVCALVVEAGGDEDEAIAALLHDAIEDQPRGGKTREDIRQKFGEHVLEIVLALTDAETHPKRPWIDRKREYIQRARTHTPAARRVSLADKLHNTRAILADFRELGDVVWDRFSAPRDDVLWYYRGLVEAYADADDNERLYQDLARVVDELERTVGVS
jgi:(p)ppGpp synthase/HD superfamily hydrolase